MIYVAKPRRQAPRAFLEAARKETQQVVALFERARGKKPRFKFRAYRHPELIKTLEQLFCDKCAYCEMRYSSVGYLEVEHYRPKSHYYWLAAEWSNLLPSCKRCNNGKLNKFPLADARKQARRKGQERQERPLLLNPSDPARTRRPDQHLTFDPADGAVRALQKRGKPSELGMKSIEVYRLTRVGLALERKSWALRVRSQIAFCRLARRKGTAAECEAAFQGLKDLLQPDQPFRALTIQILRQNGFTSLRSHRARRRSTG